MYFLTTEIAYRWHDRWNPTTRICRILLWFGFSVGSPIIRVQSISALTTRIFEKNTRIRDFHSSFSIPKPLSTRHQPSLPLLASCISEEYDNPPPSNNHPQQQFSKQSTQQRDLQPLSTWALDWGVVIADGLQMKESSDGDWSLVLTKPAPQGTPVLTVPSYLVFSSDIQDDAYLPYYDENDMRNVYTWMMIEMGVEQTNFQQNYLPEFILIFKLMREVYLGRNSRWYAWWQSLPRIFSTGLFLDDVERAYVECMAGELLYSQDLQFKAMLGLMRRMLTAQEQKSIIPVGFYTWLRESQHVSDVSGLNNNMFESLVRWAFSVVFTRSWRSPDQQHAQIVPLGDFINHDGQTANLQPLYHPLDGAFEFYLTRDVTETPENLFLSYGSSQSPARYLVLFGFCDASAAYVDARIDFLYEDGTGNDGMKASRTNQSQNRWPCCILDPSELVISTTNGAASEEVWIAFLYKVLREQHPDQLANIQNAFEVSTYTVTSIDSDQLVEALLSEYILAVGVEMQRHYQKLLETDFAPIMVTEKDLIDHPNLSTIVNYNLFMRECFIGVLKHLNDVLDPASKMQGVSDSPVSVALSSQYGANSSISQRTIQSSRTKEMSLDCINITSSMASNGQLTNPQPQNAFPRISDMDTSMDSYSRALKAMQATTMSTKDEIQSFEGESYYSGLYDVSVPIASTAKPDSDPMDAYIRAIQKSKDSSKPTD